MPSVTGAGPITRGRLFREPDDTPLAVAFGASTVSRSSMDDGSWLVPDHLRPRYFALLRHCGNASAAAFGSVSNEYGDYLTGTAAPWLSPQDFVAVVNDAKQYGVTFAEALRRRFPSSTVTVLEEPERKRAMTVLEQWEQEAEEREAMLANVPDEDEEPVEVLTPRQEKRKAWLRSRGVPGKVRKGS